MQFYFTFIRYLFHFQSQSPTEQQLREMKEMYARLLDDYNCKVLEVSSLRRETEKQKEAIDIAQTAQAASESSSRAMQEKLRSIEMEAKKVCSR